MADAAAQQDRTEAPTPKRREDARRKGQVPRSQEVTTAVVLLVAAGALHAGGPRVARSFAELFSESTRAGVTPLAGIDAAAGWLRAVIWRTMAAAAPLLASLAGAALLVGAVQVRGVLSFQPLQPDWARIAPHKNIRRLVGVRTVSELLKSLFKLTIVGLALALSLAAAGSEILALAQQSPLSLLEVVRKYAVRLLLVAGLAYLFLAAADYAYQVWQHERNLRMSREELKREQKDTEGDLMVRARLRSMGRSLARRRMFRDVPTADVVVTNPTHVAVALKYDPAIAPAPVVVAMGQRKVAERIKALALESDVPVVEDRPLARALLASGRIGLPIPTELYVAVAEVLAFVFRQRRDRRGAWPGAVVE